MGKTQSGRGALELQRVGFKPLLPLISGDLRQAIEPLRPSMSSLIN